MNKLVSAYSRLVTQHPFVTILLVLALCAGLGFFISDFRLDASADSLVVDGDPDLEYSREISERYATGDFVFVVYTPADELFSESVLADLKSLKQELEGVSSVASVDSIFGVPLFKVADASLADVADNIITLASPGIDLAAAKADLGSNLAYRDALLSEDTKTTALIVNLVPNRHLQSLINERETLKKLVVAGELDSTQQAEQQRIETEYAAARAEDADALHESIMAIRSILSQHQQNADIVMGGVPMIADDLVSFVQSDLNKFGVAILLFIVAALTFLFRQLRFVVLPLLCGVVIAICVTGLLGLFKWPVTVISSNFISLLLIITVSLTVHLIVRYRELQLELPAQSYTDRLRMVLSSMLVPCAYTSLTTIVAFGSLVISDIPPIIDFGWMMVMGVLCAFMLSFLLFPALMAVLPEAKPQTTRQGVDITPAIARFTEKNGRLIFASASVLTVLSVLGISLLKVENSFIDYFSDDTEIYRGMVTIDQRMGGTTPLDVIIDMSPPEAMINAATSSSAMLESPADEAEADEWAEDEWEDEEDSSDPAAYWFTSDKMQRIIEIQEYLESVPHTGKVLSLATLLNIAYELNDNQALNSFELGVLYNKIPDEYKESLLRPYVSVTDDQIRFSIRVRETDQDLIRSDLLQEIRSGLVQRFNFAPEQIHLSGMLVLYNNMLQSLFESQILTLSVVMGLIFIMFILLFRSLKLAIIGIIPNLLAALSVLGLMGLWGIPLDMMTITIAAISVGIGVDNTIHYIHRYQANYPRFGNYLRTMHYCHGSIGKAMYYTSFTIVAGFSILILSNFVPTIYFGVLTSLAMLLALGGALTLLPRLLITFKPFGADTL